MGLGSGGMNAPPLIQSPADAPYHELDTQNQRLPCFPPLTASAAKSIRITFSPATGTNYHYCSDGTS